MPLVGLSSRDVIIQTPRFEDSVRFYEEVLGLPVVHRSERLVGFETGSFVLYVEPGEAYGPVFEFFVADVGETARQLVANGCRIEQDDPTIPRCYVRDPNGLTFNLHAHSHARFAEAPDSPAAASPNER
jgi:catechol 2,3-dioxygenase-like lactoylglutathione lyase family enzyme